MLRCGTVESLLPFKGSSETTMYLHSASKVKLGTEVLGSDTWLQVLSTPWGGSSAWHQLFPTTERFETTLCEKAEFIR